MLGWVIPGIIVGVLDTLLLVWLIRRARRNRLRLLGRDIDLTPGCQKARVIATLTDSAKTQIQELGETIGEIRILASGECSSLSPENTECPPAPILESSTQPTIETGSPLRVIPLLLVVIAVASVLSTLGIVTARDKMKQPCSEAISGINPSSIMNQARDAQMAKNYLRARELWCEALAAGGDTRVCMAEIAHCSIELSDFTKAIDTATQMISQDLWKGRAYLLRGNAYYKQGQIDTAREDFRRSLIEGEKKAAYNLQLCGVT